MEKISEYIRKILVVLVRPLIPIKRKAVWNGVIMPSSFVQPYRLIHDYPFLPFVKVPDIPNAEGGEVNSHKEFTKDGDSVIITGGGYGVSSAHAAMESGSSGNVTVYEGSYKYSEIIKQVAELNDVSESIDVKHCIVGPDIDVYDDPKSPEIKSPKDLPECDVLEMDCEGAEEAIIKDLNISPRIIIMEIHPRKSEYKQTLSALSELGYEIKRYWSNSGQELSNKKEFDQYIEMRLEDPPKNGSPIVAADKK